jgi:hypothetical protein
MIAVVVDTNIISESPKLSRVEWISLSDNRADWGVTLLVPDVVVMETTKVVPREWAKQRDTLSKAKVGTFGLQGNLDALVQGIQNHIDGYEAQLHSRLSELGAQTVPTPDVPHSEIAFRASRGIAPYHAGDKDGYRDTLIWLTVLDVATAKPDHEVWFVSNNTNDFGDPSVKKKGDDNDDTPQLPRPLHPDLQQDLESRGLQGRVKYATNLRSLEQHIAALHGSISPERLAELTSLLDFDALQDLLNDQTSIVIPPKDAALDPGTAHAVVNRLLTRPQEWTFSDAAGRGEDRWTANYAVDAEAEILAISTDPSTAPSVVNKPLRVSGTAAFTKQGQPEEVQVSRIEALPDDPNRGIWAVLNSTGFGQIDLVGSLDPAVFASFVQAARAAQIVTLPPEIFQAMAQAAQAATQNVTLPPETFQAMAQAAQAATQNVTLPPETFQAMAQAARASQNLTLPPEIFQAMAKGLRASQNVIPAAEPTREFPDPDASAIDPVPDDDEGPEEGGRRSA